MEAKSRELFASRIGFILMSAGCAIGLGNVWRFPYIVGKYGGGLFVLLYLFFLIVLGYPCLLMELSLGRAGRSTLSRRVPESSGSCDPFPLGGIRTCFIFGESSASDVLHGGYGLADGVCGPFSPWRFYETGCCRMSASLRHVSGFAR